MGPAAGRVIEAGTGKDGLDSEPRAPRKSPGGRLTVNDTAGWLASVGRLIFCKRESL